MEWGEHEEKLKPESEDEDIPKVLLDKPTIDASLCFFYNSFIRLSRSRIVHFGGAGFIPITEIKAFCDFYSEMDEDERIEFLQVIEAMDNAFIEWEVKKRGKRSGSKRIN